MPTLRLSTPADGPRVMDIWRSAVDATHDFLSSDDRREIEREVEHFLPTAPLWLAVDGNDRAIGFMFLHEGHMEALFIDASQRGTGTGRALLNHALAMHPGLTTDVNEQNAQAVGFYERMGFQRTGRSASDSQGRPYPLIHLRHGG
ncbi:putative acetyltransferase [Luteibacter sp. Sphag1AF]|uniref:acetyltransferase n=1 Tax=Luteibacter sp. Sphag1AF TaxID=2587031 RepID=UPI00161ACB14|nr:acetyltransferase [Luteibacter sp. Sphag1AF]MBB3227243.1 putative acetyltransferase [Luteibacter sp. Sphag1AF]